MEGGLNLNFVGAALVARRANGDVMTEGKEGGDDRGFAVFWKVWREKKASPELSRINRKWFGPRGNPGENAWEGRRRLPQRWEVWQSTSTCPPEYSALP